MTLRIKVSASYVKPPITNHTDNKSEIVCNGSTVEEVLRNAVSKHPNIKPSPFDENNHLNPFFKFYVNETNISLLQEEKTKVESGDEILMVPLIVGG